MLRKYDTIGSDPEFFCYDKLLNKYVALCGHIKGTKKEPYPIAVEGCFQQLDNVSIELTVPPSSNIDELYYYIDRSMECIEDYLKTINPNWELSSVSSAVFDDSELTSDAALTFGCEPSYNIYGIEKQSLSPGNIRTAGFHIHFGWNNNDITEADIFKFLFLCDIFLGLPSIINDPDINRRKLYGMLSDYRLPKYGVEYRTMGIGMFNERNIIRDGLSNINRLLETPCIVDIIYDEYFEKLKNISHNISEIDKGIVMKLYSKILKTININERKYKQLGVKHI